VTDKKVLIAEDRPDTMQLLRDILESFEPRGVTVLTTHNGEEALTLARAEKPDLVLLDVMMPGMDGFEVCRQIKTDPTLTRTYVILITARIQRKDRETGALVGADEYVTKPFDVQFVMERIQAVLGIEPI